jgi:hypothetical protein
MPAGGKRPNSGRKSEWKGEAERIRLPIEHHQFLYEIAKRLDSGEKLTVLSEGELGAETKEDTIVITADELKEHLRAISNRVDVRYRPSLSRQFNNLIKTLKTSKPPQG